MLEENMNNFWNFSFIEGCEKGKCSSSDYLRVEQGLLILATFEIGIKII